MEQLSLEAEPGWRREVDPTVDDDRLRMVCLTGLRMAVRQEYMTPADARDYYRQWFGSEYIADE